MSIATSSVDSAAADDQRALIELVERELPGACRLAVGMLGPQDDSVAGEQRIRAKSRPARQEWTCCPTQPDSYTYDDEDVRRQCMVAIALLAVACSPNSSAPTPSQPSVLTGRLNGADYRIQVPAAWSGTLFLYSHGYVIPGQPNPAWTAPNTDVAAWLLAHDYAIAGSSYSSTGWAVGDGIKDQIALLDLFQSRFGRPRRVIAWGVSLGGGISAELIQMYPERFAGAIPMCGVLSGGVATGNIGLDGAYAFRTLLAPQSSLQLVHISDPVSNVQLAEGILSQANVSPAGQARIALASALADLPGWFNPGQPEPGASDFAAQESAQAAWMLQVDLPLAFGLRAELEQRAGGNPSWNIAVDYHHQFSISAYRNEVSALYKAAGLDLDADLQTLDMGPRIRPDPQAVAYVDRNLGFDGRLSVPVLSIHTDGDGQVPPQNETAYRNVVMAAGKEDLLRQVNVHRAGHCEFSIGETIVVVQALLKRLDHGHWDDQAPLSTALNTQAQALDPHYENSLWGDFTAPPAFAEFDPGPFSRPFPKGSGIPA